jgi:hypothetical protein
MHAAMEGITLPKFEVVKAIMTGCGGSEDDLRAFAIVLRRRMLYDHAMVKSS